MSEYDHLLHRHNFAAWAAARAAQRAFTTVGNLKAALESSGVCEVARDESSWPDSQEAFDDAHGTWCSQVVEHLKELGVQKVTYGRAAKLVAMYLKGMVVTVKPDSGLSKVAHPPVDRILLQGLAADGAQSEDNRKLWRETNWTQLDQANYDVLIGSFRAAGLDQPYFWHIERFWTVTDGGE